MEDINSILDKIVAQETPIDKKETVNKEVPEDFQETFMRGLRENYIISQIKEEMGGKK